MTNFGRRNNMMDRKKKIILAAVFGPPAFVAFIALGGEIVKLLWNWLLPPLFGWQLITFWQALALLALCRILFGGWHSGHGPRSGMRRHMRDKWENMTPEEREKFRQAFQSRWGQTPPPDPNLGD
jgi:hypothetical protein